MSEKTPSTTTEDGLENLNLAISTLVSEATAGNWPVVAKQLPMFEKQLRSTLQPGLIANVTSEQTATIKSIQTKYAKLQTLAKEHQAAIKEKLTTMDAGKRAKKAYSK